LKKLKQGRTGKRASSLAALGAATFCAVALNAGSAFAAAPVVSKTSFSHLTQTSVLLEALLNPNGKATEYEFEYGLEPCSSSSCAKTAVKPLPAGTSPALASAPVEELAPDTTYHFRILASNGPNPTDRVVGAEHLLRTFGPPPIFGPCPNDALRAKAHSTALPDCRAYEQASPVGKNGGDVTGAVGLVKAAPDGHGITFGSASGLPGGVGAQTLSVFMAQRGEQSWSTQGLLPPETLGQIAVVAGLAPGFDEVFSSVEKLGSLRTKALLGRPVSGDPKDWTPVGPFAVGAEYSFAGEGGGVVALESTARLGDAPEDVKGRSNVYAYQKAGKSLKLASVQNDGKAIKGAFAGPYDWAQGTNKTSLGRGGAARDYYTQPNHAIAADGSAIYFTEAGTGQVYVRRNPTASQSEVEAGKCTEPERACTIRISESRRAKPDPGGERPAAFMAASNDGTRAFFTSSEKLTEDANTGPEQPEAAISRSGLEGENVEEFLPKQRGIGLAVNSEYIYWADPSTGSIGRAKLDESEPPEPEWITPGDVEVIEVREEIIEAKKEVITVVEHLTEPSKPRWVAVDSKYIYWSNAPDDKDGHGTIGRADLAGSNPEPEFIKGRIETSPGSEEFKDQVSNPQGIAVNETETKIYWANAGTTKATETIARAGIGGNGVEVQFHQLAPAHVPMGLALNSSFIYWAENDQNGNSFVGRVNLDGSNSTSMLLGKGIRIRGLALDSSFVYWAEQQKEAIGRIPIGDLPATAGECQPIPTCEKEWLKAKGAINGLAVDAQHLYWSSNGENEPNPGNDLYRYDAATGELEDLAPLPAGDGAEAQGVLGISADGSRAYFAANGDLDGSGKASQGSCKGPLGKASGECNLYFWEEGQQPRFVAPLDADGGPLATDAANWAPTATEIANSASFQKTSRVTADGETLLFRSQEKLTEYDNEGRLELYLYRAQDGGELLCVSCPPSNGPTGGARLNTILPSFLSPATLQSSLARNLSADGKRVFFDTPDALSPEDTNGEGGCPPVGSENQQFPACFDVYEWEAAGEGSCDSEEEDGGCIYLVSTGKSTEPSLFGDASESGDDVFFFTREGLAGQDGDELYDVYDARREGGLAAQSPEAREPCPSVEACHGPPETAPAESTAGTETFVGPGNPVPKHAKARKHKKHKHRKHRGAHAKRRAGR
jgi:hypothetical protein